MPRAYSADLRERVLAAYAGWRGPPVRGRAAPPGRRADAPGLAEDGPRGGPARPRARRPPRPGAPRRAPEPGGRHGRAPLGGEREALAGLVAERNDATLAEYADLLAARTGVRRSPSALCRALKALGLVREKRRSGPPSGIARTWPRRGGRGGKTWTASTPPAWSSSTRPGSTPG